MTLATPREASLEYARNYGMDRPEQAWVLTHMDVWEPNPFYAGPKVPHPEDDYAAEYIVEHGIDAWRALEAAPRPALSAVTLDNCPF